MINSSIEFSNADIRKGVIIPKQITQQIAEEIGIHIGDGSLNIYKRRFLYSLRGHSLDDKNYYTGFIPQLYKDVYGINVKIRKWPDVIGFQLSSNAIGQFKHRIIGLPLGSKLNISIPPQILTKKKFICACIRGIFDTDGSLSFEKKSREQPYYPRIIFSTTSKILNGQLVFLLKDKLKFNLSTWKVQYDKENWNTLYRICIRGNENLIKWFQIIGSNNPKNIFKYEYWKKHGYAPVAQ